MTGAPMPAGCRGGARRGDGRFGRTPSASRTSVVTGQHVRRAGEDVTAGTGCCRGQPGGHPAALGLAAALEPGRIDPVLRGSAILVMSTGTELVAPGTTAAGPDLYESNAVMLTAAVRDAGAEVLASRCRGDDVDAFHATLAAHATDVDLIITTGRVSAGAYEVVRDSLSGQVEFVKVAMQPGMPQGVGHRQRDTDHHATG